MATFSDVKKVLDDLVAGRDIAAMKRRHGGSQFSWDTAEALRDAVALIAGTKYPLIAPEYVGNGKANKTYLIKLLTGPIPDESLPRMPFQGPPAKPEQIKVIREWINGGALDDPA